ncbi:MAG: hypothetical protein P8L31_07235, partial [Pseudomonadales bacterium]|nr:hypothetical protein [Pseudomonadales bacterium]
MGKFAPVRFVLLACAVLVAVGVTATEREPQYGGTLNVGTVYVTLSALSWDPADWTWKSNHDFGAVREHLFVADLSKSVAQGGPYRFVNEAHLPEDAIRGELAESWHWDGGGGKQLLPLVDNPHCDAGT